MQHWLCFNGGSCHSGASCMRSEQSRPFHLFFFVTAQLCLSPHIIEGVPEVVEEVFIHPVLFGFYTAFACLGIIFAIVCLVFNLVFKNKKWGLVCVHIYQAVIAIEYSYIYLVQRSIIRLVDFTITIRYWLIIWFTITRTLCSRFMISFFLPFIIVSCRIVKLSSPYLNTLIILGAILFYINVILFGIDKGVAPDNIVDVNCQV